MANLMHFVKLDQHNCKQNGIERHESRLDPNIIFNSCCYISNYYMT